MDKIKKQNMARAFAIDYAQHWIGTPYIFAGDDFSGFDCSGQIMEILQAAGVEKRSNDLTAHQIIEKYFDYKITEPYAGCLIGIWASSTGQIKHIGFMVTDYHVLHAGGGGSTTDSVADAIKQNAYVKCDPLHHFGANVIFVDPFLAMK